MDTVLKDSFEERRNRERQALPVSASSRLQTKSPPAKSVSFMTYLPLFLLAFAKDTLDLLFGWIPGIGAVFSFCFTILIFFVAFLTTSRGRLSLAKKGIVLMGAAFVGSIPLLALVIPEETLAVALLFLWDKKAVRRKMEKSVVSREF